MIKINYKTFVDYLFKNFKLKISKILMLSIFETLLEIFSIFALIGALTILLTQNVSDGWFVNSILAD